jgi:hypothetical protein
MKGIIKNRKIYLKFFFIILLLVFFSACSGVTPQSPVISSFSADPATIEEGDSVTLSWTTNATMVSINQGVGTVTAPSGSTTVSPTETTTYTLTATNSAGSSADSLTITVSPVTPSHPIINSFTAIPSTIDSGDSSVLSWVTTGATTVSINQGIGSVALSGSTSVSPAETTTYTLTATSSAGSSAATATITVHTAVVEQTITIQPGIKEGKDSYVSTVLPDDNFAELQFMDIGMLNTSLPPYLHLYRAYLQFNLSALPADAIILNADLMLFQSYNADKENFMISLHQVNESWTESTITWNNQPDYSSSPVSTITIWAGSISWFSWDVTSLIQGWNDGSIPNYGVILKDGYPSVVPGVSKCYSSDLINDTHLRPKLEITYYVP